MTKESIKLSSGGHIASSYIEHANRHFLTQDNQQAFIHYCGLPLRKSVRYNRLKIDQPSFLKIAEKYQWQLSPIPWCKEGFWIDLSNANHEQALGNLPEHIQGLFYIQEASSMLPPVALLAGMQFEQPFVADFAAAPGSKTTQLAAMLENRGVVLANELSASRLKGLHANLVRCGIVNTCLSHLDAQKIGDYVPNTFDFVLLDAPCGGEGTVRKDSDALKNWDLNKVKELAQLQKFLILSAFKALKPGGRLVYSTCTLSPEENQQVANFLLEETDAEVNDLGHLFDGAEQCRTSEGYLLVLPQVFDSEGFFISSFTKPKEEVQVSLKPIYSSPFKKLPRKNSEAVLKYFQQRFGIELDLDNFQLLQRDKEVWIFPAQIDYLNAYLKVKRGGMKIANVFPKKIRVTHEFACCFGDSASKQLVQLNSIQASDYYQGKNIEIEETQYESANLSDGEVLLFYQGNVLGLGLNKKGRVKNALPRDLVRDNIQFSSLRSA